MADYVSLPELAERLGIDRTAVRKYVDRHHAKLGISVVRRVTANSHGQLVNCISARDAEKLLSHYESRKERPVSRLAQSGATHTRGYFYILQLVPEAVPHRVKLGYTDSLAGRLAEHQTSAPTARFVAHWPCRRSWEQAAIDSMTREGCVLVMNEVYEGDIEGIRKRAEEFFALLPKPDSEVRLSEHSPLGSKKRAKGDPL